MTSQPAPFVLTPDRPFLSRTGRRFVLRRVRRSDEARLRDMMRRCSVEDLRLRCFGVCKSFPEAFAARLAGLAGEREFAVAAVTEEGEIAGIVHAVARPGAGGEADYDILVRTDLKGQGLGSRLMREMLAEAARRGFSAVHGEVMVGNRAMLSLAGDLGFRRMAMEDGVVRLRAVPAPAAAEPSNP